jgi:tRNA(Ile)-lysidine synthetase-like protein
MELPAGVRIELEFDQARIGRPSPPSPDEPLAIETIGPGDRIEKALRIGGRLLRAIVQVGSRSGPSAPADAWRTALPLASLHFPLLLRGWERGDRVRTSGGTKTLKKLFVERRVPRSQRHEIPVLVDAHGTVLWVGGIERAPGSPTRPGEEALFLTIVND